MKKTLGLRLVAALLLAFALISVLVIAMNYWNARTQLDKQSTAAPLASVLIKSLDALDDAEDATAVLQAFIAELNRVRQEVIPGGGSVSVWLERHGGGTVYESGHDLRNQVQVANALAERGELELAEQHIDAMLKELDGR